MAPGSLFRACEEIKVLKWSEKLSIGRSAPPPPFAGEGRGGARPAQRLWPGPLPSPPQQAGEGTRCDKRECRILHKLFRVHDTPNEALIVVRVLSVVARLAPAS